MYLFRNCPIYFQFKLLLVDSNKYFFVIIISIPPSILITPNMLIIAACFTSSIKHQYEVFIFFILHKVDYTAQYVHMMNSAGVWNSSLVPYRFLFRVSSVGQYPFLAHNTHEISAVHVPPSVPTIHVSMVWETLESCGCVY